MPALYYRALLRSGAERNFLFSLLCAANSAAVKMQSGKPVHNLAYQGVFAPQHFHELGLPDAAFSINGNRANGFVFDDFPPEGFARALRRAFALYARPGEWTEVAKRAMQQDFGWKASAEKYLALYQQVAC